MTKLVAKRLYEDARNPMATAQKTGQLKPIESRMRSMAVSLSCRSYYEAVSQGPLRKCVLSGGYSR